MSTPCITVSYNGGEKKRVSLSVQPSLELSDFQVERAEGELQRVVRKLFNVDQETAFYLYEVETKRVMSKESFREPSYCQTFPTHWYLVIDNYSTSNGSSLITTGSFQYNSVPANHLSEDLSRLGEDLSSLDLEESGLPTLTDLSTAGAKYQSFTLKGSGDTGCSLRYFSIQPSASVVRSDTPMEHTDSCSHSRSDSYVSSASADSLDALRLSTVFVGGVREGSVSARAGVERGFVVHMINGDSVLCSSVEQIKTLVDQCGGEATLLGLPQDSDDLQFLYSKYTSGAVGQFSTEEGFITVVDIPLVLASSTPSSSVQASVVPVPGFSSNGLSPPVGMMPFDDHSPENSLSCDPYPLSSEQLDKPGSEDILITGSLSEIGTHDIGKWGEESAPPMHSSASSCMMESSPEHARREGAGLSAGTADSNSLPQRIEKEWYHHEEEGEEGSQALDEAFSQGKRNHTQLQKTQRKSLEALTRLPLSDQEPSLERSTGRANYNSYPDHSASHSSHGLPSSDNSQLSGGSGSGRGQVAGHHLSGQSVEEQQMSGDSGGSDRQALKTGSYSKTGGVTPSSGGGGAGGGGRRAVRGYQFRRNLLHKSKSKISQETSDGQAGGGGEDEGGYDSHAALPPPVTVSVEGPSLMPGQSPLSPMHSGLHLNTSLPIVRHKSVKENTHTASTLPLDRGKPRPLSAIESSDQANLPVPAPPAQRLHFRSIEIGADGSEPSLFTTVTALTPAGEEQVYKEVNIEDAIARSQGTVLSAQAPAASSQEDAIPGYLRNRRHRSSDAASYLSSTTSSTRSSLMANSSSLEVLCHGVLSIKQQDMGKKSQDKSWRSYYAVFKGTSIRFYKEKRDAVLEKPCDEPPVEVVPATLDLETKNTKRKHVFRLMNSQGLTYLLQADDAPSRQRWMEAIQQENSKQPSWQNKLTPLSPQSARRMSSPQPKLSGGMASGSSTSFLGRLKRTLKRNQQEVDGTDYSSFTAFGQVLKDCPVSPDNKRVPLVVEFCVREMEEHGLTVEGIYRKPGVSGMIKTISAQMDKGNYVFDMPDYGQDIHTVGSLLKKFLKELPDPLIPDTMHDNFLTCARIPDQEARLNSLKELVFQLPTAHYHTLRFLMSHLTKVIAHSDQNKMTIKNVALVFAPTLMRSTADGEELLANMTAGYTTVELLCKHAEYLFGEELCAEELRDKSAPENEEMASRDSPPHSRSMETQAQKEQALAKASPLSVRRIQNKIERGPDAAVKRYSAAHAESLGSINKLVNQTGSSSTLPYSDSGRGHFHASDSNIHSTPPTLMEADSRHKKKPIRHLYEDVEVGVAQRDEIPTENVKSNTRTMNWINRHTEMDWARGEREEPREMTGSMWSSRNRMPRPHSREKLQNAGGSGRKLSKTKSDQGRELLGGYQAPAARSYRQQPTSVVPPPFSTRQQQQVEREVAHRPHTPGDRQQVKSRRISYINAMDDPTELPVRENPNSHLRPTREEGLVSMQHGHRPSRDEQFSSPEYSASSSSYTSNSHRGSEGTRSSHIYQPHPLSVHPHPPSSHHPMHHRVDKYGSNMTTPINPALSHRRSSESTDTLIERGSRGPPYYHPGGRGRIQGLHPQRTFSNERTYNSNSPPQREHAHTDHMIHTTPPRRTAQVESYL